MARSTRTDQLDRIEAKLDRILAHLEGLPMPAPQRDPVPPGQEDPLHVWRATFSALHHVTEFPELLREWFRLNPGSWTSAEIIAVLTRRNANVRTVFPVRLTRFIAEHPEWLGVVREKRGKSTLWRSGPRRSP